MSTMLIRMIALMCLGFCGLLDDAGYGDLSSYGQTKFQTPHIDRLAKEGLKFTDHYSASTVCAPTRCSLMTGLHTGRCYIRDNNEVRPEGQGPMPVAIPHAAMQVPEDSVAPFRKRFARFEETIGRYAGTQVRNPVAGFAGMMTHMDNGMGQVLALLEELEIDNRTLVMLSSDNGPHLEGGRQPDFFNSNGPFRGYKRDL